jgi:nitrogenase molybdenum-iron protein alpha/beta subunit
VSSGATGQLNIICGPLSPADMRTLKRIVAAFSINAVIFPDISENLDRPFERVYQRLPAGGTTLEEIRTMSSAALTLELACCLPDRLSPGVWLRDTFGVPLRRLDLPIGLRGNDQLMAALAEFAGVEIPADIQAERGRYLDALIDSHKYNAEGRAVICGEPDFCYSLTRLAAESGIVPVVVACGSKVGQLPAATPKTDAKTDSVAGQQAAGEADAAAGGTATAASANAPSSSTAYATTSFQELLQAEVAAVAQRFLVEDFIILDDADFGSIEQLALEYGANVIIGSSDARRIAAKHDIALVRAAFPVHDQVGGQRLRSIGYEGSLELLDRVTNALLDSKHRAFRSSIRDEFLKEDLEESYDHA